MNVNGSGSFWEEYEFGLEGMEQDNPPWDRARNANARTVIKIVGTTILARARTHKEAGRERKVRFAASSQETLESECPSNDYLASR